MENLIWGVAGLGGWGLAGLGVGGFGGWRVWGLGWVVNTVPAQTQPNPARLEEQWRWGGVGGGGGRAGGWRRWLWHGAPLNERTRVHCRHSQPSLILWALPSIAHTQHGGPTSHTLDPTHIYPTPPPVGRGVEVAGQLHGAHHQAVAAVHGGPEGRRGGAGEGRGWAGEGRGEA